MNITFLESGIDSLRKGAENLIKYEENFFSKKKSKNRFFFLKDSVILTLHGVEVLIKHILANTNELLIFSNLDKHVQQAFIEKRAKQLNSIFETSLKNKIHTVSFLEAITRLEIFCNVKLNHSLKEKLLKLESYRNIIVHSEIYFDENEINELFDNLYDELDSFFISSIGNSYNTVSGYSELKESYEVLKEYFDLKNETQKKRIIEDFIEICQKYSISMGINEVKIISDISKATNVLQEFLKKGHIFGGDFYSLACSGIIKRIERKDNEHLSIYAEDIMCIYTFKFKNLLIYMPNYQSDFSPLFFLEAEEDCIPDYPVKEKSRKKVKSFEGLFFPEENKYEYNLEKVQGFYDRIYDDDEFVTPTYYSLTNFLSKGLVCFLNFQYLPFHDFARKIVYDGFELEAKQLLVELRKSLNTKQSDTKK